MKKMIRPIIAAAMLGAAVLSLTGCGSDKTGSMTTTTSTLGITQIAPPLPAPIESTTTEQSQ
jgi:hypothetical protein